MKNLTIKHSAFSQLGQALVEFVWVVPLLLLFLFLLLTSVVGFWSYSEVRYHCRETLRALVLTSSRPEQLKTRFCNNLQRSFHYAFPKGLVLQSCHLQAESQQLQAQGTFQSLPLQNVRFRCVFPKPEKGDKF